MWLTLTFQCLPERKCSVKCNYEDGTGRGNEWVSHCAKWAIKKQRHNGKGVRKLNNKQTKSCSGTYGPG